MIRRTLPLAATLAVLAACGDTEAPTAPPNREPLRVNATAGSLGYVAIDLSPDGQTFGYASAINDVGQVVIRSGRQWYLWEDGQTIEILVNGVPPREVTALNQAGQVLGFFPDATRSSFFLWENESATVLRGFSARSLNDLGQVAGIADGTSEVVIWSNGATTTVPTPGISPQWVRGFNNSGQILVQAAQGSFLVDGSNIVALSAGPAVALNERGQVAGVTEFDATGVRSGYLYDSGLGTTTTIPAPGTEFFTVVDLSDDGQVFGGRRSGSSEATYFVWDQAGFQDVNQGDFKRSLLQDFFSDIGQVAIEDGDGGALFWESGTSVQLPEPPNYSFPRVWGLNNRGHVVGQLVFNDGTTRGERPILWRPVSPVEAIDAPKNEIENLVSSGDIDAGNGNALTSKLNTATALLNDGKPGPAINKLEATINQLNAMMPNKLDPAIGQPLVDQIQTLIDALS